MMFYMVIAIICLIYIGVSVQLFLSIKKYASLHKEKMGKEEILTLRNKFFLFPIYTVVAVFGMIAAWYVLK